MSREQREKNAKRKDDEDRIRSSGSWSLLRHNTGWCSCPGGTAFEYRDVCYECRGRPRWTRRIRVHLD